MVKKTFTLRGGKDGRWVGSDDDRERVREALNKKYHNGQLSENQGFQ